MSRKRAVCVEDLDLDQLLADPLVRLIMSSDDVEEADIRRLARDVRAHRRPAVAPDWSHEAAAA